MIIPTLFLIGLNAHASLEQNQAVEYSKLSLACMDQSYPYKIDHVYQDTSDVKPQPEKHPMFFGCFDWHSAVHGHWALVRILNLYPKIPNREEIEKRLGQHFLPALIAEEKKYFERDKDNKRSERPYGHAWFLRLMLELRSSQLPTHKKWAADLAPLENTIRQRFMEYLEVFTHPIRRGVHENSAFALTHVYDYAMGVSDKQLLDAVIKNSKRFFIHDKNCPLDYEPEGDDFISPCLTEADLMRRVLPQKDFLKWFNDFWPKKLSAGILKPQIPSDLNDPKAIHLLGLNFQKAWSMEGIASALNKNDPRKKLFMEKSNQVADKSAELITKGGYGGTHWLASFAIFYYTAKSNI